MKSSQRGISGLVKNEWPLLLSSITTLLFLMLGKNWMADFTNPFWFVFILTWLFGIFALERTNVLLGAVHLLLFLAYLMLIFES
jgi:Ca2+/H+ antiporter